LYGTICIKKISKEFTFPMLQFELSWLYSR